MLVSKTAPLVIASEHWRVFKMWYFMRAGGQSKKSKLSDQEPDKERGGISMV